MLQTNDDKPRSLDWEGEQEGTKANESLPASTQPPAAPADDRNRRTIDSLRLVAGICVLAGTNDEKGSRQALDQALVRFPAASEQDLVEAAVCIFNGKPLPADLRVDGDPDKMVEALLADAMTRVITFGVPAKRAEGCVRAAMADDPTLDSAPSIALTAHRLYRSKESEDEGTKSAENKEEGDSDGEANGEEEPVEAQRTQPDSLESSRDIPHGVQTIALASIRADSNIQPRETLDENVVSDYATAMTKGTEFPPVVVFNDGSINWLADGFHRHAAAVRANRGSIVADVRQGSRRDAILHAVGANAVHGLRRTNADKRKAATLLLMDAEWASWSDNEIARRCCVSPSFVGDVRRSLSLSPDNGDGERTYRNKQGGVSKMKTGGIGRVIGNSPRPNPPPPPYQYRIRYPEDVDVEILFDCPLLVPRIFGALGDPKEAARIRERFAQDEVLLRLRTVPTDQLDADAPKSPLESGTKIVADSQAAVAVIVELRHCTEAQAAKAVEKVLNRDPSKTTEAVILEANRLLAKGGL